METIIKAIKEAAREYFVTTICRVCWKGDPYVVDGTFHTAAVLKMPLLNRFYPVFHWWREHHDDWDIGEPKNSQDEAVKLALEMGRTISV